MDYIDAERSVIEATYGANMLATNPASGRLTTVQIDERIEPERFAAR
jgi:hypothetical protein